MSTPSNIFAVQDRTGTVAQLTLDTHPLDEIEVNDTGTYTGLNWEGTTVDYNFTVCQVDDQQDICITVAKPGGIAPQGAMLQGSWPRTGTITWLTGANVGESPALEVEAIAPANAYITVDFFTRYHNSRGNAFPDSPVSAIESAIVQATDYLDQRYRFKGVKLLQFLSNPFLDPMIEYVDPWLGLQGFIGGAPGLNWQGLYSQSSTFQHTEWPRQGCVDYNGDNVYGVPLVVQMACAEGALRVVNGTPLQPDYDPTVVTAGAVVASTSSEVGPIKVSKSYDTKLGLSFFPSIPHIDRMLRSAGLLVGGGGRSIIR